MAEQCTNPDYQILLQPGTRHSIRITEMRIGMTTQRIGPIEVEMRIYETDVNTALIETSDRQT